MAKKIKGRVVEAKDMLVDKAAMAKDAIAEKATKAKEKIDKYAHKAGKYIDKNPRKAAAIAVGVGAALAAVLVASTRKKKRGFFD